MLSLRPLELQDADAIFRWHSDPELFEHLVGDYRPVQRENVREWLARRMASSDIERNYAICRSGEHVGNLYLRDIDWEKGCAELHIFIGDASNRGQGIGTEAMRLALDQAFGALALKEVFLHVLATNQSAIRLYERCGFTLQGKRAAPAEKRCGTVDVLRMSLRKAKREP